MKKTILALFVAFILAMGWTLYAGADQTPAEGKGNAVIVQSFASKEMRAGDVWKIYLKASDPEGKMKYIFASIFQPGVGSYSVSITRIKEENQKELSGYIYLNTAPARQTNFFNLNLILTISIKDEKGFSESAVFPLSFKANPAQEAPLEGVFKEQDLGPIMITLRSVGKSE